MSKRNHEQLIKVLFLLCGLNMPSGVEAQVISESEPKAAPMIGSRKLSTSDFEEPVLEAKEEGQLSVTLVQVGLVQKLLFKIGAEVKEFIPLPDTSRLDNRRSKVVTSPDGKDKYLVTAWLTGVRAQAIYIFSLSGGATPVFSQRSVAEILYEITPKGAVRITYATDSEQEESSETNRFSVHNVLWLPR